MARKITFEKYTGRAGKFEVTVPHQRLVKVDGDFVGYAPVAPGPIQICGFVPDEVQEEIKAAAQTHWQASAPAEVVQASAIEEEEETPEENDV